MSRTIFANPYTGERLKEPFIVHEDHYLRPEDFYNLGTEKTKTSEEEPSEFLDEDGFSKVNNPTHYQSFNPQINIDCITAMRAAFGDDEVSIFCKLNAFKYNWRAYSKGKNTDIGKAVWYLNKYLELNK